MRKQLRCIFYVTAMLLVCSYNSANAQWQVYGNRNATDSMKLGTIEAKPVRLITGGTNRMIIDANGRVGIGTDTPTHTLHVKGQLRLVDNNQGNGKVLTSDATGLASWQPPASSPWFVSGNNMYNNTSGNVGVGVVNPLFKLEVGGDVRLNGLIAGKGRNSLTDNTAFGVWALDSITTGTGNTATGYAALNQNKTGQRNNAFGANALSKNTSGNNNTANGANALRNNTTGSNNIAVGDSALINNTIGGFNTMVGNSTGRSNISGDSNTAQGYQALWANTTGERNTAVGFQALANNTTGSNNTAIGIGADVLAGSYVNATAIGANAKVGQSNSLVLGSGANVGIGTATPSTRFHVNSASAGAIRIVDGTQAAGRVLTSDANGVGSWLLAPGSMWTTSNAPNTSFSQSGNVGIGNPTPTNKLDVTGNGIRVLSGAAGSGTGVTIGRTADEANFAVSSVANQWATGAVAGDAVLRNSGGGKLLLQAGTTNPHVAINTNGNVGIGTLNPQARLDVNGNIRLSVASLPMSLINDVSDAPASPVMAMTLNYEDDASRNIAYPGGAYRLDSRNTQALHQWYSIKENSHIKDLVMSLNQNGGLAIGSTFATLNNAPLNGAIFQGNVGIGTPTPNAPLQFSNSVVNRKIVLWEQANNDHQYFGFGINGAILRYQVNGGSSHVFYASTSATTSDELMRIQSDGKVGIGTPIPSQRLEVIGNILQNLDNSAFGVDAQQTPRLGIIKKYGYPPVIASDNGSPIIFSQSNQTGITTNVNGATLTERMRIDANGQIGIGIIPDRKFVVSTSEPTSFAARIENTANTSGAAGLEVRAGQNSGSSSTLIGFQRPDGITIGGVSQNSSSSVGYYTTSDTRLKSNIAETRFGIADVMKIQVRDYDYKTDKSGNRQTGFLAQQLYTVFPNAVTKGGEDVKTQPWMVDYGRMTPLIVKGMQDQQTQISALQKQNEQLQVKAAKVDDLQKQIDELKAMIQGTPAKTPPGINQQDVSFEGNSLEQNIPNPPTGNYTRINYNIPNGATKAELVIVDNAGRKIKTIGLNTFGKGVLNVNTKGLASGTYTYTMYVDGRMIDTKKMFVTSK